MKLNNLTFIITNACNYNCSYCHQARDNRSLDKTTVTQAAGFFYPHFTKDDNVVVGFYGGEPLLEFPVVEHTVDCFLDLNKDGEKSIEFALTTNGSLIDEEMLQFFAKHRFILTLSFDGLAQDFGRQDNSRHEILAVMKKIKKYENIDFEINSVFSPDTVDRLADSILYMINEGAPAITFNVSYMQPWTNQDIQCLENELERLSAGLLDIYRQTGNVPVTNFKSSPGNKSVFRCNAGNTRMAVAPGGDLWGCFLFYDFFKDKPQHPQYRDFSLGSIRDFTLTGGKYKEKMVNYGELRQDYFQVEDEHCFLCEELQGCNMCPVNAAYGSGYLGKIPCSKCRLSKLQNQARKDFQQSITSTKALV